MYKFVLAGFCVEKIQFDLLSDAAYLTAKLYPLNEELDDQRLLAAKITNRHTAFIILNLHHENLPCPAKSSHR